MKRIVLAAAVAAALPAAADIAVMALDNKMSLDNGVQKVLANPPPDAVAIVDMSASPPKVVAEVKAPGSIVGPPLSVAITQDESLALATANMKIDPADATKTVPDNKLSVIDLKANPPAVIATLEAGAGAAGVAINKAGTLALVANRNEGSVSVFTISGKTVTAAGKIQLGAATSGPSGIAITPDGKRALVTRDADHTLSILNIDGSTVTDAKRDFGIGYRPYGVVIAPDGGLAAVANVGRGVDEIETVSLIDMKATPPRVIDSIAVPQSPEGIAMSPDGKMLAIVTHNGSVKPKGSPFYNANGKVVLLKIDGRKLVRVADASIGTWAQGAAFSKDGKTLVVQNMVEKELQVMRIDGDKLTETARVKLNGGPVAIRTAW